VGCESGLFGCTVATFPWIIAGLAVVLALLLAFRLALQLRGRFSRAPAEPEVASAAAPKPAPPPGSPLQPPPSKSAPAQQQTQAHAKPSPLKLRIADAPDLRRDDFQDDGQAQGDFGELVTSAFLSAQGWKQLPSKLQGGRGIDGLFVREVRGGGGFECLATETKTNSSSYDAASMSDDKIAGDIAELFELGALDKATAEELTRGVRQGASFFRKELWRHDLSSGMTAIAELGRGGEKGRSITRSSARLIAALHMSVENLDRRSVYIGRPPVGDGEG
jgi:hypothetical protein